MFSRLIEVVKFILTDVSCWLFQIPCDSYMTEMNWEFFTLESWIHSSRSWHAIIILYENHLLNTAVDFMESISQSLYCQFDFKRAVTQQHRCYSLHRLQQWRDIEPAQPFLKRQTYPTYEWMSQTATQPVTNDSISKIGESVQHVSSRAKLLYPCSR